MESLLTERAREPGTPIECGALRLFRLSSIGAVAVVSGFISYLVLGIVFHWLGFYSPEFTVMSFADPVFTILGFLTGIVMCVMSGSLAITTRLLVQNDYRANFVVLMSLIAFGFGAAVLRVTAGPTLACLTELRGL